MHDILVFGGAANTGLHFVKHARARGLRVAAMVRGGRDTAELDDLGVTVLHGDAFNLVDCQQAIDAAQPGAVVSLLGGKDATGRRVDAEGNINVIDAAAAQPGLRFVLLTSLGCDEQFDALSPDTKKMLQAALEAKTLAERHLRSTNLDWSIVRPGGLTHETATGQYTIVDAMRDGMKNYLPRSDAALALLDVLQDHSKVRQTLTVLA